MIERRAPNFLLSFCTAFLLGAVPSVLFAQHLSFKKYSVDDVLPSSTIYMAFQDSQGYVWFGTDLGVSRFDGYKFTNYAKKDGLGDNEVFNFFEDSKGRIWLLSGNGRISYYKDGVFVNGETDPSLIPLDARSHIAAMEEDSVGSIWITTYRNGIRKYDADRTAHAYLRSEGVSTPLTPTVYEPICGAYPLGENQLLILKRAGFFKMRIAQNDVESVTMTQVSLGETWENHLKPLRVDNDNIIFKNKNILFSYSMSRDALEPMYQLPHGVHILNICNNDEYLWLCTTDGAFALELKTRKLIHAVLPGLSITSVLKDWEGNYWFTSLSDGLYFCTSLAMYGINHDDGLITDRVTCLARDTHNRIWFGYGRCEDGINYGAVSYYSGKRLHHVTLLPNKSQMTTQRIYFSNERTWIATNFGLFQREKNKLSMHNLYARDVLEFPKDNLWIASGDWIATINRKVFDRLWLEKYDPRWRTYVHGGYRFRSPKSDRVKCFFVDSDSVVWVATDKDLYRFQADSLRPVSPLKFGTAVPVSDIKQLSDKTIILATNGEGLIFMKNDQIVQKLDEGNGLISGICNAVSVDRDNNLWVATNHGLERIKGYPDNISIEHFNVNDGLLSSELSDLLVANDTVWVSSKKGINLFHKDSIKKVSVRPRIFVNRLIVEGQTVNIEHDKELLFKHNENNIEIWYTGLSYTSGPEIVYRYKLHEDEAWQFTKNTSVRLVHLPAGQYHFVVSALGKTGMWSEEAQLEFEVRPPFWRTPVFIGLVILILCAVIFFSVSVYVRNQRTKLQQKHRVTLSELRSLRAQMNPHFLFNALNSIQGVLLRNNIETTQDYLGRFGKLMRLILDHSDKTTITIAEELESITNYLEIEQLRAGHSFQYTIEIDEAVDIHTIEIPAMILQPFIENSIWHGFGHKRGDDMLIVSFASDNDHTLIAIVDNGIGRKRASAFRKKGHKSKGLQLVTERIDILNHGNDKKIELRIEDLEDDQGNHPGTRVTIKIPLNQ